MNKKLSSDKFKKDLEKNFKKFKFKKIKNVYITSNLSEISGLRIKKELKLKILFNSIKNSLAPKNTIISPAATLNLCNSSIPFDIQNTPSNKMGPLAEYIRKKSNIRSLHPYWSLCGIGHNKYKVLKDVSRNAFGAGSPWARMMNLDFYQINIGIKPSRAVTLIHHIETIFGVPYRYNKQFEHEIVYKNNKKKTDFFYMPSRFKTVDIIKKKNLNEHFFAELKKKNLLIEFKTDFGLSFWIFKMNDFYKVAISFFIKDIFNYLEKVPDLSKIDI